MEKRVELTVSFWATSRDDLDAALKEVCERLWLPDAKHARDIEVQSILVEGNPYREEM